MKRILLTIIFYCTAHQASSQNLINFKEHCGLYYKNIAQLEKQISEQVKFYDFHPGQVVASVGAQCANWEASFAALSDSITFYLEDIDSTSLNDTQAAFAWRYYSDLRGKPITCIYKIIIGNKESTNLPAQFFDKILIINSFHEFENQKEMLDDIRKKLKSDGILTIDETLAKKSGELHIQCKKRIYTEDEIIAILKENGFTYITGLSMDFRNSKPLRKIFAFRKS